MTFTIRLLDTDIEKGKLSWIELLNVDTERGDKSLFYMSWGGMEPGVHYIELLSFRVWPIRRRK